jgi:hypothetical protein
LQMGLDRILLICPSGRLLDASRRQLDRLNRSGAFRRGRVDVNDRLFRLLVARVSWRHPVAV